MRDPDRMVADARAHGEHLGRFMQALLAGDFPWAKLRQAQMLLRLGQKYGWPRVDSACQRALAFDLVNVHRVERILRHALDVLEAPHPPRGKLLDLGFRFQRPAGSFLHSPRPGADHDRP